MLTDEELIRRCFDLAKEGIGNVAPNPLVGAIISKYGKVISSGYHKSFGSPHAEIEALNKLSCDLKDSVLYVNLEPCSHYGKTPPCTESIINSGIRKVVISCLDPNPLVNGNGVKRLREAGIEVIDGILEQEGKELNKIFFQNIIHKLPYVCLKVATSINGKITNQIGERKQITNSSVKSEVKKFRHYYGNILIGARTLEIDNPMLSLNDNSVGIKKIFVLTKNFSFSLNKRLLQNEYKAIVKFITPNYNENLSKIKSLEKSGFEVFSLKKNEFEHEYVLELLNLLINLNVYSILVEGGTEIFSLFIKSRLFNELNMIIAPVIYKNGLAAFNNITEIDLNFNYLKVFEDNVLINYRNHRPN